MAPLTIVIQLLTHFMLSQIFYLYMVFICESINKHLYIISFVMSLVYTFVTSCHLYTVMSLLSLHVTYVHLQAPHNEVTYELNHDFFAINSDTGMIRLKRSLLGSDTKVLKVTFPFLSQSSPKDLQISASSTGKHAIWSLNVYNNYLKFMNDSDMLINLSDLEKTCLLCS